MHKPLPHLPAMGNLLLIGSAGRNLGKTLLACSIIARFKADYPVVGLKVTAIREVSGQTGSCPRGGAGCGVCSSLTGNFELNRETQAGGTKDTSRLLASGALAVYWLKVLHAHLLEGLAAVLELLPQNALVVCESNSLRTVVEPGLFLFITGEQTMERKQSAVQVKALADRLLVFDGKQLHFSPGELIIRNNTWEFK